MLGLDTNVLIRYLVRDDLPQYQRARRLITRELTKGEPVLVSLLVLLETEWVLHSRYDLDKTDRLTTISALLDTADLAFEDEACIEEGLYGRFCRLLDRSPQSTIRLQRDGDLRCKGIDIGRLCSGLNSRPLLKMQIHC